MSALGIFVQMQGDLSRLETESFLKMKTDEDETCGFKSGKDPQGEYIKRSFQRVERVKHHCDNRQ